MCQKQHGYKQRSDDPRTDLDLLEISAKYSDDQVGDQAKSDAIGDVVGKGHHRQGKESGNSRLQIVPIHVPYSAHHQNTHVDQRRSSGATGHQLSDAATPAFTSLKVVTVEVPQIAPAVVARASESIP